MEDARHTSPDGAWHALLDGNARFASGRPERPRQDASRRAALAHEQRPFAVVVGCSDSRVPMEVVLDCGIGDLFVVRTAGHVVSPEVLGTVEFGLAVLDAPLVVVLGHRSCGAVGAAVEAIRSGVMPEGHLRDLVVQVVPSILAAHGPAAVMGPDGKAGAGDTAALVDAHVRATVDLLAARSSVLAERVAAGSSALAGATYDLTTGRIIPLTATGLRAP